MEFDLCFCKNRVIALSNLFEALIAVQVTSYHELLTGHVFEIYFKLHIVYE